MNIIIFSGTTEGRQISEALSSRKIPHILCVATISGELVMQKNEYADIRVGCIKPAGLKRLFIELAPVLAADATHPYAESISKSLKAACAETGAEYIRIVREASVLPANAAALGAGAETPDIHFYKDAAECEAELKKVSGNIFLTTGSKDLNIYAAEPAVCERLYVRVLPNAGSLKKCIENGIRENHIVAMYGPHSKESNLAMIRQFDIAHLVTKESGKAGGFEEKLEAARETGCSIHIIRRPAEERGISADEAVGIIVQKYAASAAEPMVNKDNAGAVKKVDAVTPKAKLNVKLIGIGPGSQEFLTVYGKEFIEKADLIIGAARMLEPYKAHHLTKAAYMPEDVLRCIKEYAAKALAEECESGNDDATCGKDKKLREIKIAVLFSGDTGIYSGADKLYETLLRWKESGPYPNADIAVIPGISSFSYFASRLGESYTGARLLSIHGKSGDEAELKKLGTAIRELKENGSIYVLLSGRKDLEVIERVCGRAEAEMKEKAEISASLGYQLSYPEERIISCRAAELVKAAEGLAEGLYILRIKKEAANADIKKADAAKSAGNKSDAGKIGAAGADGTGRIMIAAPKSGSGKTVATIGLIRALLDRGDSVRSYKCGPDYIDPMFHSRVLGVPSENLDCWFYDREGIIGILNRKGHIEENSTANETGIAPEKPQIQIIEAAMGLYDGLGGIQEAGSAYALAEMTGTPAVLVIDAGSMGRTAAAVIAGLKSFDRKKLIKGVILNKTGKVMYERLAPVIKDELGLEPLGYIPKLRELKLESRHLGLKLPSEIGDLKEQVRLLAETFAETLDLGRIEEIALAAPCLKAAEAEIEEAEPAKTESVEDETAELEKEAKAALTPGLPLRLAVARDEAFCFYYEENLRLLKEQGIEPVEFSPLHDKALPDGISGLLLGGGYPELYLKELSENAGMRESVKKAIEGGLPSLAECGGFMYLHEYIEEDMEADMEEGIKEEPVPGKRTGKHELPSIKWPMAGVVKGHCVGTGKLCRFGYIEAEAEIPGRPELKIKGHEFHYYDSSAAGTALKAVKPAGGSGYSFGYLTGNSLWGFPHFYYGSAPAFAKWFADCMREYRQKGQ
ncbi:MAG: cobyrinate a,c-diamide synthase [Eubacteriales bacterium]|nr:cobyrinate a,c-diamide synthase [Eubacteriales bacterium]